MKFNDYENGDLTIYNTLNDFIMDYKQYYSKKRDNIIFWKTQIWKTKTVFLLNVFDDIFHDFISCYLYQWNIGKYENVTILKYDDYIVVYTKNKKYEWIFDE